MFGFALQVIVLEEKMKIKRCVFLFVVYIVLSVVLLFFCIDEGGLKYQQFFAVFVLASIFCCIYYERDQKEKLNEQLESERKSLRSLIEFSPDGIYIENEKGEILDCNRSGHEIFSYTKEEMLTKSIRDLVPDDYVRTLSKMITDDMITGSKYVERVNKKKDGTLFPTEINTQYITIGDQKRLVAYIRDVSERKRLENRFKLLSMQDDLTDLYI